ncbi:UNKNOWN [Stylonychia lemnae]|uniref:Uncharacterized protein n=1 Tax=Stylonychia lemnae TaxID=5949 RepID=A0A078ASN0_STYLE|nr:UNKNOWN [Stylonychia lemnae]|eukprot:CDW85490.1 UNKNOWN [Stylonychia lemnae]
MVQDLGSSSSTAQIVLTTDYDSIKQLLDGSGLIQKSEEFDVESLLTSVVDNYDRIKMNDLQKVKLLSDIGQTLLLTSPKQLVQLKKQLIDHCISMKFKGDVAMNLIFQRLDYLKSLQVIAQEQGNQDKFKINYHEMIELISKLVKVTPVNYLCEFGIQKYIQIALQNNIEEDQEQLLDTVLEYLSVVDENDELQRLFSDLMIDLSLYFRRKFEKQNMIAVKNSDPKIDKLVYYLTQIKTVYPQKLIFLESTLRKYRSLNKENNQPSEKSRSKVKKSKRIQDVITTFTQTRQLNMDELYDLMENQQVNRQDLESLIDFSSSIYPLDQQILENALENARINDHLKQGNSHMILQKLINNVEGITTNEISDLIRNFKDEKEFTQISLHRAKMIVFVLELYQELELANELEQAFMKYELKSQPSYNLYNRVSLRGQGAKLSGILENSKNKFLFPFSYESMNGLQKQLEMFIPIERVSIHSEDPQIQSSIYFYMMNNYDIYRLLGKPGEKQELIVPRAVNFTKQIIEDHIENGHQFIIADEMRSFSDHQLIIRPDLYENVYIEYNAHLEQQP